MQRLTRIAIALTTALLLTGMVRADNEQGPKGRRGHRGPGGGGPLLQWFMEKDDVKAEVENHRETMQSLFEELKELRAATREKMRDAADQAAREELMADTQAAAKEVFARIVDERIRHQEAKTDLMARYRDEAVEAFGDIMQKRAGDRGQGQGRGQGHHRRNGAGADQDGKAGK